MNSASSRAASNRASSAEPTLVKRKQTGWAVLGFLLFATVLAWFAKKQVWAPVVPKRRKD